MGWKLKRKEIKLKENQEKDITLTLKREKRAAIHGIVKLADCRPAKNAIVKLFKKDGCNKCNLTPITFAFTDECGQFLFGVDSGVDYVIKVFYYVPEKLDCGCDCDRDCGCDC